MAKITMSIDTEEAVDIITGVASILNDKVTCDGGNTYFGNGGFRLLQDALLMAAKAIDVESFDGSLTKDEIIHIEGSKE